jgi:hypothetical protein
MVMDPHNMAFSNLPSPTITLINQLHIHISNLQQSAISN